MAELGHRADGWSQLGPILSCPIPSCPIPSHPTCCAHAQGQDRRGAGAEPRSAHAASPGASQGHPSLGRTGLGCVLRPLPQPLSSGCSRSLPDAAMDRTQEQEPARGLFRRTLKVPAGAGPAATAQPSTVLGGTPWNISLFPVLCSPADVPEVCARSA